MANRRKEQFVVKLSVEGYRDFAEWMLEPDPNDGSRRRYQIPESGPQSGRLSTLVSEHLDNNADIFENCDDTVKRKWNKDTDDIVVDRDKKVNNRNKYPMAVPDVICEDQNGNIDFDYLKSYVAGLCALYNTSQKDAACALLGMYFLSRCR